MPINYYIMLIYDYTRYNNDYIRLKNFCQYLIIVNMKDNRLEILGNNIRAERMRKKISQEKLAEIIDVNKDSIRKIEAGLQKPSAFIVFDIANALNISVEELFKNVPQRSI